MLPTTGPLLTKPTVAGGGGITDPLDLDANLLGYWENNAGDLIQASLDPVDSNGDLAITWTDLSSAGNDLEWNGLNNEAIWRPGHVFTAGPTLDCIECDHATYLAATLAAPYVGDNLAWFAKLSINTLTNNNSRAAAVFDSSGEDTDATGGIFLIATTAPAISMFRDGGGGAFGGTTAWADNVLITVACWFDGTNKKFYVDGVLIDSEADTGGNFSAEIFSIGNGSAAEFIDMHLVRHALAKDLTQEQFDDLMDWFVAS